MINEFSAMLSRVVSKKIIIKKELQDGLWNVKADKTQVEQILMNLSMNSVDAMPKGGDLIYKMSNFEYHQNKELFYPDMKKGKYVKLEIIDSGTGIPPQVLDKIFDPFFSSKEEGKGTGLGLSIVYGIIQSYGGVIDVESEINKGTHFSIFLPATTHKKTSNNIATFKIPKGKGKIMLVDDESMLRETVSHMLESMAYDVFLVNDGKEAVGFYEKKSNEIDLIIMDIQMPEMDGIEAASLIWGKDPEAKIIFSSGYADPARLDELRRKGIKEVLRKPYKMNDLAEAIHKSMNHSNHS
jgi:CheY-like chemotaxis protein